MGLDRSGEARRPIGTVAALAALAAAALPGCGTSAEGRRPEGNQLYFPTGLTVSPGRTTLYVANSDFDLQFSGGSVQAVDLDALRRTVRGLADALADQVGAAEACASAGLAPNADTWLYPGPCGPIPYPGYVAGSALIGAFASGLLLAHRPDGEGARLFVPVRGDPSITYFDVTDDRGAAGPVGFRLECGVDDNGFCGTPYRIGQDRDRTLRDIQLPADPLGIAASADGVAVVTAHQTQQAASLLVNHWDGTPELTYFTAALPPGPTEVAAIPEPGLVAAARGQAAALDYPFEYRPSFLVTFRASSEMDILQYVADGGSVPSRPFLNRASATELTTSASNYDSRGVAVVDTERRACERSCGQVADVDCLWACAEIPLQVFAANRNPASLLIGELSTVVDSSDVTVAGETEPRSVPTSIYDSLWFYDTVPVGIGASRVETGYVLGADGTPELRVFAVCFDSRSVYVYDPATGRVEAVVRTGRGPHDIAVDTGTHPDGEPYAYLYVGHFTDSYIGVAELDRRRPHTYGQLIATIGMPNPPQEAK